MSFILDTEYVRLACVMCLDWDFVAAILESPTCRKMQLSLVRCYLQPKLNVKGAASSLLVTKARRNLWIYDSLL